MNRNKKKKKRGGDGLMGGNQNLAITNLPIFIKLPTKTNIFIHNYQYNSLMLC